MLDIVFVVAFVALPVATFLITRSLAFTAIGLGFGIGITGNVVQSTIAWGWAWNTRGLQWLVVGVMALVLAAGALTSRSRRPIGHQVLAVVVPAVAIGLFLIAMRLLAPEGPGPLSAVGYLINHPQAEDNAKWLHLAAQLADGRDITFNGYAGGPLLLVMAVMAALVSVLSMILLGGVNEVAVAVNSVVGAQFLLIALVPFAFAAIAERKLAMGGPDRRRLPIPALWAGMFVAFIASSVVTSFGHLSLQFVLLVLIAWSAVFLARTPGHLRLLATLTVATTASVWIPLNILGVLLLVAGFAWTIRRSDWRGLAAVAVATVACWDALVSSTLFLFGIDLSSGSQAVDSVGSGESAMGGTGASLQTALSDQAETAKSLFTAPGGVEQIEPLVAGLALASVLFAVWLLTRHVTSGKRRFLPFAPMAVLGGYLVLINLGDAITTGGAPHYGGHKLAFAFTIMALASTLPIAIAGLDGAARGMTVLRWAAVGGVVLLLTLDTMLPRALSALSPMLWPTVDSSAPAYWSPAEVKPVADQPISSLPVACLFAPPESDVPTSLPLGQQSYNCTRLLLGMNGLEGDATVLVSWLQTDWMSNEPHWEDFHQRLTAGAGDLGGRTVILMNPENGTAGLSTLGSLLQQYPPAVG